MRLLLDTHVFLWFITASPRLLAVFAVVTSLATTSVATTVPARDPHVQVEGRTGPGADGALRVGYPGVTFRVRFEGPKAVLRCRALNDTVYLDVAVDGGEYVRRPLTNGPNELVLFEGEDGVHLVEVVKRTESWQGELVVETFEAARFLAPDPLPERRLMFIGDSITCGQGADVRPDDPPQGAQNSSGRHTFGWLLARRLDAQLHLVSYGGRGALRTWQGEEWPENYNAPQFYPRAMPDDADSRWDPRRFVPDAVVICLGTNDFNLGAPDRQAFVDAYRGLIRQVREDFGDAWLLVADSPMYGPGEKGDTLRSYLDEVVAGVDDGRLERVALSWRRGRPEDSHPVASDHVGIADELEPVLRARLGW